VQRTESALEIGPSVLRWEGDALEVHIDEVTAPVRSRIHGVVRVRPAALPEGAFALDAAGRHRWTPIAPCARVEVALDRPPLHWSGDGYLDSNAGDEPLEDAFTSWTWSRAADHSGTTVLYDVVRRRGERSSLALTFDRGGKVRQLDAPPVASLPPTRWRVLRETRTDVGSQAIVLKTLEDTPFYARSVVEARLLGKSVTTMHESLSLERFRARWVQLLLPFRAPRARR